MGPIASLFARIGVKADTQTVERFDLSLKSVLNTAKVAAIGLSAFSAGVTKIALESFKTASALKQFEVETGASTTELQKWQAVAEQAGSSAESVSAGIRSIVQNQQNIRLGKGNYSPFLMLGIDPMQDPFKVLQDFREKARGLAPAMQATMAKNMGLSTEMLRVLRLSNDEFDRMAGGAFYMTPGQINSIDKARESVASIQNAFGHLFNQITAAIAPEITKLAKGISNFVKTNQGFINGVRTGVQWVMKLADGIGRVVMRISDVVMKTMGWQGALLALGAVFAIINAPVMLLAGGLLMLFLIIEDIIAYTEGRDSLIGRLFEASPELKKAFDSVMGFLKEFMEFLGAVFRGDWTAYEEIIKKWGFFGTIVKGIGEALNLLRGILWGVFTGNWSDYNTTLSKWGQFGQVIRTIGSQLSLVGALAKGVFTGNWGNFDKIWQDTYRQTNKALGYSDEDIDKMMGVESDANRERRHNQQAVLQDWLAVFGPGGTNAQLDAAKMMPELLRLITGNAQTTNNVVINVTGGDNPQATADAVVKTYRDYIERRPGQK